MPVELSLLLSYGFCREHINQEASRTFLFLCKNFGENLFCLLKFLCIYTVTSRVTLKFSFSSFGSFEGIGYPYSLAEGFQRVDSGVEIYRFVGVLAIQFL